MNIEENVPRNLLIVDEDATLESQFKAPLSKYNVTLLQAKDIESAHYLFNQRYLDTVLVSSEFAGVTGLTFIQKCRANEDIQKQSCGFLVSHANPLTYDEENLIKELGSIETIQKPFVLPQLLSVMGRAQANKKKLENYLQFRVETISYLERSGDIEKAIELVQDQMDRLGVHGLDLLLTLFERSNRNGDALQIVDALLQKKGDDIRALSAKGRLLLKLGKNDEARAFFERADSLAPLNLDRISTLGVLYLKVNEPKLSVQKFKVLIEHSPEDVNAKFRYINLLFENGFDYEAKNLCDETSLPVEVLRHYNNIGVMHARSGQFEEAVHCYKNALKLIPQFRESYKICYNLAVALLKIESTLSRTEAEACLQEALKKNPGYEKAQKALQALKDSQDVNHDYDDSV